MPAKGKAKTLKSKARVKDAGKQGVGVKGGATLSTSTTVSRPVLRAPSTTLLK